MRSRVDPAAVPHRRGVRWSNWGGNQSAVPAWTLLPRTEGEVVAAVRLARAERLPLRVVGAGHSFSPLAVTDGVLVDLSALAGLTGTDRARGRVRLRAGTRISAIGDPLWAAGLALSNQGDIDRQTIAGALATGTHGSGIGLGAMSSALRWVRLVDGRGEIREYGEDDLERLRALQVSLGVLGVFLEVELAVEERYLLAERFAFPDWPTMLRQWDERVSAGRFSFFWCRSAETAGAYGLPVPDGVDLTDRCWARRLDRVAPGTAGEGTGREPDVRVDRSYRVYADDYDVAFHELEYTVAAADGAAAAGAVRELLLGRHADQRFPMDVRWVRADDAYLSPFCGRDSAVISVSGAPGTDYQPFLRDVDAVLADFDARAHWGKINFLDRGRVGRLYPELDRFAAVRGELDPDDVFLSPPLAALLR